MTVKNKNNRKPLPDEVRSTIIRQVSDLLEVHTSEIQEVISESESQKVNISFGSEIDCSESVSVVRTRIRFATTVTDSRVDKLDDEEAEPVMPGMSRKELIPGELESPPVGATTPTKAPKAPKAAKAPKKPKAEKAI
jgi:hypothetical protein